MSDSILETMLETQRTLAIQLRDIKEKEMGIRREICEILLEGKEQGTHNFTIGGMKVKVVKAFKFQLDKGISLIYDDLDEEEKSAIRVKYEVAVAVYKKLTNADQLNEYITVVPASPTLTVVLGE